MKTLNFQKTLAVLVTTSLVLLATNTFAQDSQTAAPPATVSASAPQLSSGVTEVLRLAQAKVGNDTIIAYIKNSGIGYSLNADQIIGEYVAAAEAMAPHADYLMLNLSCPNTVDGRDFFADAGHLDACLAALGEAKLRPPVFLKVSPLGGVEAIERMLAAADGRDFVSGFMFNLSPVKPERMRTPEHVWREMPGAVSGPPAAALADFCIREAFRRMDRKRHVVIGAGGVSTAADAYAKIRFGASLVQLLTALIYQGPGVVRRITSGLAQLLARDGVKHVADVVGVDGLAP